MIEALGESLRYIGQIDEVMQKMLIVWTDIKTVLCCLYKQSQSSGFMIKPDNEANIRSSLAFMEEVGPV